MSVEPSRIFCTGCDYESQVVFRPIRIRYQRDDGASVEVGRTRGWCYECDMYTDIENIDPGKFRSELIDHEEKLFELNRKFSQLPSGLFSGLLNRSKKEQLKLEIDALSDQISQARLVLDFFEKRASRARCLKCYSEHTAPVSFDAENHTSKDFVHHCGGKLLILHKGTGLRLNFRSTLYVLDPEGQFLWEE